MSLILSFGKWGGIYFVKGYTIRLCLGWIAFTYLPLEIDDFFGQIIERFDERD